ncbi:MAG: hypothetical protein GWO08_02330, partial [Gammaproteobacteria bacterium]|nr:hypothetical protein [Gammaproteobacteria bacterium]
MGAMSGVPPLSSTTVGAGSLAGGVEGFACVWEAGETGAGLGGGTACLT